MPEQQLSSRRLRQVRRVVYISRSLIGADTALLAGILAVSKVRNAASGVTGLLWWTADTFAQALEGEDGAVGQILQRIGHDPRHADMEMVQEAMITSRLFGAWSMAEANGSPDGAAGTAYLVGFCARQPGREARQLFNFLMDAGY